MKGFKEMAFEELVDYIRGELIVSLGKGTFKQDVFFYCELVLRWANHNNKPRPTEQGKERK